MKFSETMIRRATIKYFKRFNEQSFDFGDSVALVGPNNAGKSHAPPGESRRERIVEVADE
jgi:ABC-type polysaccharide/polyol phosphate transport system ATPase subunit